MSTVRIAIMLVLGGILVRPCALVQGVKIGDAAGPPDASALLDLDVPGMTGKKGILIPRMTETEKLEIISPTTSLMVYQTDATAGFYYYDGTQWVGFGTSSDDLGNHTASENIELNGNWLSGDGDAEGISIAPNGNIGLGVASANANVHAAGPVMVNNLAGSGNRMVIADANGQLSTQDIPAVVPTSLSASSNKSISSASYSGGSSVMTDISLQNLPAGTYLVQYSLVFSGSSAGSFMVYAGGTSVAASERSENSGNVSGMAVVTLSSTGDIQLRGKKDGGGSGLTVTHRTLTAVQTN
jgi:hypothetical protein